MRWSQLVRERDAQLQALSFRLGAMSVGDDQISGHEASERRPGVPSASCMSAEASGVTISPPTARPASVEGVLLPLPGESPLLCGPAALREEGSPQPRGAGDSAVDVCSSLLRAELARLLEAERVHCSDRSCAQAATPGAPVAPATPPSE